jgi:putative heme-binding domain-containing protein
MRPTSLTLLFILLPCAAPLSAQQKEKPKWPPSPHIASTDPLRPEEQIKKIKLPPGFELQLVAADPDIRKPININFDAAGRLWLTETIEYPFAAKEGQGRDAVKILEDFGPDGKARKITTFADKLNIPIGVIPDVGGKGALIYSIPAIYHMTDAKGTGKADRREIFYSGFGFNDTHGMTGEFQLGFDGWIYACHGFSNTSKVKSKGDTAITMTSGNTYRIKPDGSRIEQWTWGQVNPFGLAFDPYGNLYSGDCHSQPLTMLVRHGWYVSFARPHDGLGFAPHMNTFGSEHSTALCGVAYYAADQYPEEYRGRLFLGDVVTNKINSYQIEWNGASPKAVLKEFLTSSDPWFRPVDIKLGPDGCLYFADFYNRIIGHYEVPLKHPGRDPDKGRIWRIVYRGKDGKSGPQPVVNLAKADVKTLVQALGHANLTVRLQATHQLVERGGKEAVADLQPIVKNVAQSGDADKKVHALWALARLGQLDDDTLAAASSAKQKVVRVHAQRILTEKTNWTPKYAAIAKLGLDDKEPAVQRVALESLAAHPAVNQIEPILMLERKIPAADTHLHYAARLALRDQLRSPGAWEYVQRVDWRSDDLGNIADVCFGIHAGPAAEFLKTYWAGLAKQNVLSPNFATKYTHHIVRYGSEDSVKWVIDHVQQTHAKNLAAQGNVLKTALQAAQERGLKLTDVERTAAEDIVVRLLQTKPANELQLGVELAAALKLTKTQPQLLAMVGRTNIPEPLRKACITALVSVDAAKAMPTLSAMLLNDKEAIVIREQVANALAGTNHPDAHAALLSALQNAPARLQDTIALGMASSPQGGDRLLQAIEAGKASPRLLQDRGIELRLANTKIANVKERLQKLAKGLPAADQKLQELIGKRRDAFVTFKADAEQGQKVFQKHCANCHQIANQGAKVGPQLDGIGNRGLERLLEDVLDPNRNVDQAFRTTIITTKAGQILSGLFLREEGDVVILADKDGKDVRIEKGQIEERAVSPLSPMPGNFLDALAEPELHHLMAYLLTQRSKEK